MTVKVDVKNGKVEFRTKETTELEKLLKEYIKPFADTEQRALQAELEWRKKESIELRKAVEAFISDTREKLREALRNNETSLTITVPDNQYEAFFREFDIFERTVYLTDGTQILNEFWDDVQEFNKNLLIVDTERVKEGVLLMKWRYSYSTAYRLVRRRA